jgi:hypothetical protein
MGIDDTHVLHFVEAYTQEQSSFINKFSGNAGSDVAKLFSPARCLRIYTLPACSAFRLRRECSLQFAIQHVVEPNKMSHDS